MKILIYTQKSTWYGFRVGGAETSCELLARELARREHEVHYLTEKPWKRWPSADHKKVDGVHIHAIGYTDLPSFGNPFLLWLRKRWARKRFERVATRILKRHKIELLYTYHEWPALYTLLELRERHSLSFKSVLRIGGLFWATRLQQANEEVRPAMVRELEQVFSMTDLLNPNTPGMQDLFQAACSEHGIRLRSDDWFVHDIGIDTRRAANHHWQLDSTRGETHREPGSKPGRESSKSTLKTTFPHIIMASRFTKHQKRQELLIEAMDRLKVEGGNPGVILELIGDGPNREALEAEVRRRGLNQWVQITPFLAQEALWEKISRAELLVHATDFEGLSKILAEAMAMGVPILASDVVPVQDYIQHDETGWLVANRSDAWAQAIQTALSSPKERERVGRNARRMATSVFAPEKRIAVYEEKFQRLVRS